MNKFIKKTINKLLEEFNDEENKNKIYEEVITPILDKFTERIYPYVTLLFVMYTLNLVLIIAILFIILMTRKVK